MDTVKGYNTDNDRTLKLGETDEFLDAKVHVNLTAPEYDGQPAVVIDDVTTVWLIGVEYTQRPDEVGPTWLILVELLDDRDLRDFLQEHRAAFNEQR